jgi:cell division protein FtsB
LIVPGPTNTDLIRELTKDVTILKEQVQALRGETAPLREITTKIAVIEHHIAELKKGKETLAARAWMILAPLIAGIAGVLLTHYLKR